jgi:tetratricopeptide (TPR) repeat protein
MLLALLFCVALNAGSSWTVNPPPQVRNTIEGRVTNSDRRPLSDLPVLLQNDAYSPIATTYTNGSGQFRFSNLQTGNYYVQVEPGALDYERQTQRVEAIPFNERRGRGGEIFRVDFVLRPKKHNDASTRTTTANGKGVVFYQPVPDEARKEYAEALKSLERNDFNSAASLLSRAIELFPDYYVALELLGTERVKRQQYQDAIPPLARAIEVNKDGWRAFYSLGVAQHETNQRAEAIKSFRRAAELNPDSANTNMWLGVALAPNPDTRGEAIRALEKAVSMAKDKIPQAYFYLGALYARNNQYREAADAFENFLRAYPQAGEQEKIKKLIDEYRQKARAQGHN